MTECRTGLAREAYESLRFVRDLLSDYTFPAMTAPVPMPRPPDEAGRLAVRRRPLARPVMFQQWRDLLFLHWEFSVAEIQRTLPEGLFVDTFEGKAYLGVVPFFMQNIRPRFLPAVPGLSNFMEMNLRTYVHDRAGVPGVWFYSLDANQPLAVAIARRLFHLPYEHATMKSSRSPQGLIRYESQRRGDDAHRMDDRGFMDRVPFEAMNAVAVDEGRG